LILLGVAGVGFVAFAVTAIVLAQHQTDQLLSPDTSQSIGLHRLHAAPPAFSLDVLEEPHHADVASPVTMTSLRGHPLVLNLWSSSCTACEAETSAIESVARGAGGSVDFVGVDTAD